MEQLQVSYIRAIAASAGCIVASLEIDDGVDVFLNHRSDCHTQIADRVARLEVQLKATSKKFSDSGFISTTMTRNRWKHYRTKDPEVSKIIIIMAVPTRQEHWTYARHKSLSIHYCGYWVNIAGADDTDAERPTVKASREDIFNDVALCDIMERIGQGGAP
jgi:hypothetical protein